MYWPSFFKGLFDFGYQRRGLEIPTFFFTYLIGSIMLGAIVGTVVSALTGSDQIRLTWRLDHITASVLFLIVTHFIIKKKGIGENIKIIWLLPLVTAALTLYLGHVIALIIPTILSAVPNNFLKAKPTTSETQTNSNTTDTQKPAATSSEKKL